MTLRGLANTGRPAPRLETMRSLIPLIAFVAIPLSASADEVSDSARYQRCLSQIPLNADAAIESALGWISEGGGAPAKHCHAPSPSLPPAIRTTAPSASKRCPRRAGTMATICARNSSTRPEMPGFSPNSPKRPPMISRRRSNSAASSSSRLQLQTGAYADRARAYLLLGKTTEAGRRSQRVDCACAFGLRLDDARRDRACAGNRSAALADVEHALKLDDKFPEALLERGRLRVMAGDVNGARQDFVTASLLAKKGAVADAAQSEMQKLDIRGQ